MYWSAISLGGRGSGSVGRSVGDAGGQSSVAFSGAQFLASLNKVDMNCINSSLPVLSEIH